MLLVTVLTGCSVGDDGAEEAAQTLARALESGSLEGVELTSNSDRERYDRAVEHIAEVRVAVSVEEVVSRDHTAAVTLGWSWDLGGGDWSYTTRTTLTEDAGTWDVEWTPRTLAPGLRSGELLDVDNIEGERGDILGQGGVPLVTDRPVVRYGLDKSQVPPSGWAASATRVARTLGVDPGRYQKTVVAFGPEAFVEAIVLRAEEALTRVDEGYGAIPGASAIQDAVPLAPTKEFAAPILGSVGTATAENIEASGGMVEEGDNVGLSGLQLRYEETLRATAGVRVQAVASDGTERTLFRDGAEDGADLRTTLDPNLQLKADDVLAQHVADDGPDSALVAIRASTGEILAAANGPANNGFNAATAGQYAPGSTFKIAAALALLRSGLTSEDLVECTTTTDVDGRSFKNYDDYPPDGIGTISLTTAIANSCNTALIASRDALGKHTLEQAAAALGLGIDHDLGFTAYFGQAPPSTGETDKAADMIGQGKILASPMSMAAVAASVQAGRTVLPMLLPDHDVEQTPPAAPLTEAESAQLRAFLRAVVTEGSGSFLAEVPGEVGAKTGTAEYGQPDASGNLKTHTWMIATKGDLAVAVFVETGVSGSQTAGPILEDFLR